MANPEDYIEVTLNKEDELSSEVDDSAKIGTYTVQYVVGLA